MAKARKVKPVNTKSVATSTKTRQGAVKSRKGSIGSAKATKSTTSREFTDTVGDTVISQKNQEPIAGASRVTYPYTSTPQGTFPQSADLFIYGLALYPAGDAVGGDSLARNHYQAVIGPKLLAAIRRSLTYGPAVAITINETADYINIVSNAYFHLLAFRNHFIHCFHARGKASLSSRFDNIYDETIPPAHARLANALGQMFLPPRIKALVERLAMIYSVDEGTGAVRFQLVPHPRSFNSAASYSAAYVVQTSAVEGIAKRIDMNTAFDNPRFESNFIQMMPLDTTTHRNPDNFLSDELDSVYDEEMLDIWSNLPLEASDAVPALHNNPIAAVTTTMNVATFGNKFTKTANGISTNYVTANTRHEPGIIIPVDDVTTGPGASQMRYVASNGNETSIDITNTDATAFGVMARNVENVYNTTVNYQIMPSGSSRVVTTMEHKASDAYDVMDVMFN